MGSSDFPEFGTLHLDSPAGEDSPAEVVLDLPDFRNEIRRLHESRGGSPARENQLGFRSMLSPELQKLEKAGFFEKAGGADFVTDHEKALFLKKLLPDPGKPLFGGVVVLFRKGGSDAPGNAESPKNCPAFEVLQSTAFAALSLLEKLGDPYSFPSSQGSKSQAEGGGGLSLSLSRVDLHIALRHEEIPPGRYFLQKLFSRL
jgi:hypothetical protein